MRERIVSPGLTPRFAGSKRYCVQSPLAIDPVAAIIAQSDAYHWTRQPRWTPVIAVSLLSRPKVRHGTGLIIWLIMFICFNFCLCCFGPNSQQRTCQTNKTAHPCTARNAAVRYAENGKFLNRRKRRQRRLHFSVAKGRPSTDSQSRIDRMNMSYRRNPTPHRAGNDPKSYDTASLRLIPSAGTSLSLRWSRSEFRLHTLCT